MAATGRSWTEVAEDPLSSALAVAEEPVALPSAPAVHHEPPVLEILPTEGFRRDALAEGFCCDALGGSSLSMAAAAEFHRDDMADCQAPASASCVAAADQPAAAARDCGTATRYLLSLVTSL